VRYLTTPTSFITVDGTKIAYGELSPGASRLPLVMLVHLAANLDNWDPRLVDQLANDRHLILLDLPGVGASGGTVTLEEAGEQAARIVRCLGHDRVDLLGLSMGGMIAQEVVRHDPELVERLILVGTGPRAGLGIDKVTPTTFRHMLRAALKRKDPKCYIFYTHDARGEAVANEVLCRLGSRSAQYADKAMAVTSFLRQLRAIKRWGTSPRRRPVPHRDADPDRQWGHGRHGANPQLLRHTQAHRGIPPGDLPARRSRLALPEPRRFHCRGQRLPHGHRGGQLRASDADAPAPRFFPQPRSTQSRAQVASGEGAHTDPLAGRPRRTLDCRGRGRNDGCPDGSANAATMMGKLQDPPYSAVSLAAPPSSGLYAFRPLDQEQIAEDALAIILLCALRHEDDIAGASTSAANHGDSNATAALAGTLVGTRVDFNESPGRLVAPFGTR